MNLITRMMKRYIKTPLKYALPLFFIGALVLVSTAGCTVQTQTTTSPTNQADITSYPQAGQHSQLVEALAESTRSVFNNTEGATFNEKWLNDTTVQLTVEYTTNGLHETGTWTYAQFPSVDAATAYFYSLQPQYPQKNPIADTGSYSLVTNHEPGVFRGLEADFYHTITQTDDVVMQYAGSSYSVNQA